MFTSFVSLNPKALFVKAISRVFHTEIGISPSYLLTTASSYRESHPQLKCFRDLLTITILLDLTYGSSRSTIVPPRSEETWFPN